MPNLPTLTVSDAQLARVTAAFPGDTNAEKVAAYKAWLKSRLIDEVARVELAQIAASQNAARAAIAADVATNAL